MDWYVWDWSGRWKYWMKVKGKIGLGFLDRKKHKPYQLFTFCRKLFESLISLNTTVKKYSFNNSIKTKFTIHNASRSILLALSLNTRHSSGRLFLLTIVIRPWSLVTPGTVWMPGNFEHPDIYVFFNPYFFF